MTERRFRYRTRWAIALRYSGLPRRARAVAHALGTYMRHDGSGCRPGLPALMEATGYGRSSVLAALGELEAGGWISRGPVGGRGAPTTYTPLMPDGAEARVEAQLKGSKGLDPSGPKGSSRLDERVQPAGPTPIEPETTERGGAAAADPVWVQNLLRETRRKLAGARAPTDQAAHG